MKKKTAIIVFLGNPNYDTRISNLKKSLEELNITVKVVGFDWLKFPGRKSTDESVTIHKLNKHKIPFTFYLKFIALLKYHLLFKKYDYYFSEDILTLPLIVIAGKIFNGKIFYDSRELYPFVGGLNKKSKTQKIIAGTERIFIKYVNHIFATGEMDKEFLEDYYKLNNVLLLRNLPFIANEFETLDLRSKLNLSPSAILLLYQGVLLNGRGLKLCVEILKMDERFNLVLLGDGEIKNDLIDYASELGVSNQLHFLGRIEQSDLIKYTSAADIGLSLIENISKSYYYALPNKLFEYIMAGLPVIVSDLPQMKHIIEKYAVGNVLTNFNVDSLHQSIIEMLDDEERYASLKINTGNASELLNWENEFEQIKRFII